MDDATIDRELGDVLSELIDAVQQTKQALWSGPRELRDALEDLDRCLIESADVIAMAGERRGGRSAAVVSPTGRKPPNLKTEAGDDPQALVRVLLDHLGDVSLDLRQHAERLAGNPEAAVVWDLAEGLDQRVEMIRAAAST
jgi:hypothetical protein